MTREELALEAVGRSRREYPDAGCTLDYNRAWELLVSMYLAVQCADAWANVVVQDLYSQYPSIVSLATADVTGIERIVRPCDLGHSKARGISTCMKILCGEYGGNVSNNFDTLLRLPGVGRKSTNLIMGDVFSKPVIVTDTRCICLVDRMDLVDGIEDSKKVEMALWKLIPTQEGSNFHHRLVHHGRGMCTARTKPHYEKCCLEDICAKAGVME